MDEAPEPILTPQRVEELYAACLAERSDHENDCVIVEGIVRVVGFHRERLEARRQQIHDLLAELPDYFKKSSREGGWDFLHACVDRHGRQWTSRHRHQEQLMQLGLAIGEVEYLHPRDKWPLLPGGMPYFVVKQ